jgi:hypothetical protein
MEFVRRDSFLLRVVFPSRLDPMVTSSDGSGLWKNVSIPADRAAFQWLFLMAWQLFISTFAQFISAFVFSTHFCD